jgi:hypothetical protein
MSDRRFACADFRSNVPLFSPANQRILFGLQMNASLRVFWR